jgi:Mg-chelatase subunit ChlD
MMPTQFRIIKSAGSRFVVVMDTSGSMKEFVSGISGLVFEAVQIIIK